MWDEFLVLLSCMVCMIAAKPIENENNDVQKAIAASLQDMSGSRTMLGGQLSQEDREISR